MLLIIETRGRRIRVTQIQIVNWWGIKVDYVSKMDWTTLSINLLLFISHADSWSESGRAVFKLTWKLVSTHWNDECIDRDFELGFNCLIIAIRIYLSLSWRFFPNVVLGALTGIVTYSYVEGIRLRIWILPQRWFFGYNEIVNCFVYHHIKWMFPKVLFIIRLL